MALSTIALASLEDTKAYLGIKGNSDDPQIERTIDRTSAGMEDYLGFGITRRQFTDFRVRARRGTDLRPWARPIDVTAPVTITVDGVVQTVWRTEADGLASGFDVVVDSDVDDPIWRPNLFYRAAGWEILGSHPSPIQLTYVGGFLPVPQKLLRAFFLIVEKAYRDQSQGLQELVTVNTPSGGVTLFDRPIPFEALQILDQWRGFRT